MNQSINQTIKYDSITTINPIFCHIFGQSSVEPHITYLLETPPHSSDNLSIYSSTKDIVEIICGSLDMIQATYCEFLNHVTITLYQSQISLKLA